MSRRIDLRRRVAELEGKVGNPTRLGSPSDRRQPPGRRRPSKCWGAKPPAAIRTIRHRPDPEKRPQREQAHPPGA
jgi:hypothetical protein